jgi:YD repeat-containing protein
MKVRDYTPADEPRYRARFYFDPHSLSMAEGDAHVLSIGKDITGTDVVRVWVRLSGGNYQVRANLADDGTNYPSTGNYTISDTVHFIEIDWAAATAPGANDGYLTLWVDGALQNTVSGVDNDTRRLDKVYLGPSSGLDAGTSGTEYFDAFESRRSTYIGPVGGNLVTTTINYVYDPLYRLTNANYSGAYTYTFAYAYDPVGNRTVQTRTITNTQVTTYTYDVANRMTKVGTVNYTWDNNGNLLNDGSSLYRYDPANRLISTTLSTTTTLFSYNGDGARLRQVIAGVPTTYTQDLAVCRRETS